MTIRSLLSRRVLVASAAGVLAISLAALGLAAAASSPEHVAAGPRFDRALDHVPAPQLIVRPEPTTTVPPPPPEPEPEAAPAPPPAAPAPKKAAAPKPAPATGGSEAAQLISLVNRYRAAHGLPGLAQAGDAMAKAQQHAQDMAAQGHIYHSSSMSSGISPGWSALGENVGMGGSVSQIESMFEASGPHRANLLNGAYNQIGVGVARGSDGSLYVTEFFVGR